MTGTSGRFLSGMETLRSGAVAEAAEVEEDAPGESEPEPRAAVRGLLRRPADHVVLVSVDALRPEFYLEYGWPVPTVRELAGRGLRAGRVRSVFPAVTYPAHATLVTGALPARHGVVHNQPFAPDAETGRWYWEAEAIRVPTLWQEVRWAGGTVASLGWPTTVGAPVDWCVPEVWPLDPVADPLDPVRRHARPAGLVEEIERESTGPLTPENFTLGHLEQDERAGEAAAYLFRRYRPTLLALHLVETDRVQHEEGRQGPGLREALAVADAAVSRLQSTVEEAGLAERTAFVIVGDHGFVDVETALFPNAWLRRAGLREERRVGGPWRATFRIVGGAAFLRLRRPDDHEAVARVREILDALPGEDRSRFRVVERAELERLGADPESPLALAAHPGTAFGAEAGGRTRAAASGGADGHHPEIPEMGTGFLAAGAGVGGEGLVEEMRLEDVAPTVAALLGLEFDVPDGSPLPEVLGR